jgi:activating signal cointegrator 1
MPPKVRQKPPPASTTAPPPPTRVLSIREPWATLIVRGYRPVEHRGHRTSFRGRLAIHAAQAIDGEPFEEWDECESSGGGVGPSYAAMTGIDSTELRSLIQPGCIVGSVELWDCREILDCFDDSEDFESCTCNLPAGHEEWLDDGWVWLLRDARLYRDAIPARGMLGLWKPPAAIATALATAERSAIARPFHPPLVRPQWLIDADEPIPDDPPDAFYPCALCEGSGKYEGKTCDFCNGTGKDSSSP